MNKKGYLEISFSWIFAILVGGTIIFFAISAAGKLSDSGAKTSDVISSKEIGVLLNPLESGFTETKTSTFSMPKNSKLFFTCDTHDAFGNQEILVRGENFDKFSENNQQVTFQDRYIFAEKVLEGREFNVFSKPFSFPFKTATLIYVYPAEKNYCFMDAPSEIQEDVKNSKIKSIIMANKSSPCSTEDVKVCFGDGKCEINIRYNRGELTKDGNTFYFQSDALMYGAIFSEKRNYDCQVERLMKKVAILSNLYVEKSIIDPQNGCMNENQDINSKLRLLESFANEFKSPEELEGMIFSIQDIEDKNDGLRECKLW